MRLPRITCADCPGEPHSPGPGHSVETFAAHLKTFLHRTKVELAITAGREFVNLAVSGRTTTPASHRLAYPSLAILPSNCTQVARRISEKIEIRVLEIRPNKTLLLGNIKCNLEAALAYTRGQEVEEQCLTCVPKTRSRGPFQKCIVMPDEFDGACTNCWYNRRGTVCSLHRLNADPTKPRKPRCMYLVLDLE